MVLKRSCALFALLATACITSRPVARASSPTTVAAAFVLDSEATTGVTQAPAQLIERVRAILDARNLVVQPRPAADWATSFAAARITRRRLELLARANPGAQALLLIETRATYDTLLNGRYRWTVSARATMARPGDLNDAVSVDVDLPAVLDYDFQAAPDAIGLVSRQIADRVGHLADQFLGGAPQSVRDSGSGSGKLVRSWSPAGIGPGDSIYFVLVDRFFDGDKANDGAIDRHDPQAFHGGDLQGVLDKLDYIQKLGFTTVWLSPVFQMQTTKFMGHGAYHGYWVDDFARVEPRFGTAALLRKLSDALHARHMKLLLDIVLNHVGYDSPLPKEHPDWFHHNGSITNWSDPRQLTDFDVDGLPDWDQSNPAVYRYLLKTSERWIDLVHPDGFRLDAVKHIPLSFWARYNDAIRGYAGPNFFLLGEDLDGDPPQVAHVMRAGHFSAMFDFPLYFATIDVFCKGAPPERIGSILSQDDVYDQPQGLVSLVDNHDLPRLVSACGGDLAKARNALFFATEARGITSITYGTEKLQPGRSDPANRADLDFSAPRRDDHILTDTARFREQHADLYRGDARVAVSSPQDGLVLIRRSSGGHLLTLTLTAGSQPGTAGAVMTMTRRRTQSDGAFVPRWTGARARDVRLAVRATGVPAGPKDKVVVVGSVPLGDWRPAKGVPLSMTPGGAYTGTVALSVHDICAFKLAVRHADGTVLWESSPNRYLAVRTDEKEVDVTWNGALIEKPAID